MSVSGRDVKLLSRQNEAVKDSILKNDPGTLRPAIIQSDSKLHAESASHIKPVAGNKPSQLIAALREFDLEISSLNDDNSNEQPVVHQGKEFRRSPYLTKDFGDPPPSYSQSMREMQNYNVEISLKWMPNSEGQIERVKEVKRLKDYLLTKRSGRKFLAILGSGGSGKTSLACSFMKNHRNYYSALFFLRGDSERSLEKSMAHMLDQIWKVWSIEERPHTKPTKPEEIRDAVKGWLSLPQNHKWLMVFDGVDDVKLEIFLEYIPSVDRGAVIITTRSESMADQFGKPHKVGKMTSQEASELLAKCESYDHDEASPVQSEDRSECLNSFAIGRNDPNNVTAGRGDLLEVLDGLPLAIESVGHRIRNTGISHAEMLKILRPSASDNYDPELYKIYKIYKDMWDQLFKISRLEKIGERAAKLLLVMSYLNPKDIFFELLEFGQVDSAIPDWYKEAVGNRTAFRETFGVLRSFGFVHAYGEGSEVYSMHDLARFAFRRLASEQGASPYFRLALACVNWSTPQDTHPRVIEIRRRLSPHAEVLIPTLMSYLREKKFIPTGFLLDSLPPDKQENIRRLLRQQDERQLIPHPRYYNCMERIDPYTKNAELLEVWTSANEAVTDETDSYLRWIVTFGLAQAHLGVENPKAARNIMTDMHTDTVDLFGQGSFEVYLVRGLINDANADLDLHYPGVLSEAEALTEYAARIDSKKSFIYIGSLERLSYLHLRLGNVAESQRLTQTVLLYFGHELGFSHPMSVRTSSLVCLKNQDEFDRGKDGKDRSFFWEKVCEGFEKTIGVTHPETLSQLENLVWIYSTDDSPDLKSCIRTQRKIAQAMGREQDLDATREYDYAFLLKDLAANLIAQADEDDEQMSGQEQSSPNVEGATLRTTSQIKETHNLKETIDSEGNKTSEKDKEEKSSSSKELTTIASGSSTSLLSEAKDYLLTSMERAQNLCSLEMKTLVLQSQISLLLSELGLSDKAIKLLRHVLKSYQALQDAKPDQRRNVLISLATLYKEADKTADLEETLKTLISEIDEQADNYKEALCKVCGICTAYGLSSLAFPLLQQFHSTASPLLGPDLSIDDLQIEREYSRCLRMMERFDESIQVSKSVLSATEEMSKYNLKDVLLLKSETMLGLVHAYDGKEEEACRLAMSKTLALYLELSRLDKDYETDLFDMTRLSGEIFLASDDLEEAEATFLETLRLYEAFPNSIGRLRFFEIKYFLTLLEFPKRRFEGCQNLCIECIKFFQVRRGAHSGRRKVQVEWLLILCLAAQNEWQELLEVGGKLTRTSDRSQCRWPESIAGLMTGSYSETFPISTELYLLALRQSFEHRPSDVLSIVGILEHNEMLSDQLSLHEEYVYSSGTVKEILWFGVGVNGKRKVTFGAHCERPFDIFYIDEHGRDLFAERPPEPKQSPDDLLNDLDSKALLLGGNIDKVFSRIPDHLRNALTYNPPPEFTTWPRSWTCSLSIIPESHRRDIPLWIAGAPVILNWENRYPVVPALVPPDDPHEPIAYWDSLDRSSIEAILKEYDFSWGFAVMLNGELQVFVPKNYDIGQALIRKPRKFGGLRVGYGTPQFIPAMLTPVSNAAAEVHSRPRFNCEVDVKIRSRPGREGKATGRIGVPVRSCRNRSHLYFTMATHTIKGAIVDLRTTSKFRSLSALRWPRKETTTIWSSPDQHSEPELIAKITESCVQFDTRASGFPPGNHYEHDVTLIRVNNEAVLNEAKSSVPNLGWIRESEAQYLRGATRSRLKLLRSEDHSESNTGILATNREYFCQAVGQVFVSDESFGSIKPSVRNKGIEQAAYSIRKCLIFRVPARFNDPAGQSGTAVYHPEDIRTDGSLGPAVVGFVSFFHETDIVQQNNPPGAGMEDPETLDRVARGLVPFWGAYPLPPDLWRNYEIICERPQTPKVESSTAPTEPAENTTQIPEAPAATSQNLKVPSTQSVSRPPENAPSASDSSATFPLARTTPTTSEESGRPDSLSLMNGAMSSRADGHSTGTSMLTTPSSTEQPLAAKPVDPQPLQQDRSSSHLKRQDPLHQDFELDELDPRERLP